VIPGGESCCFAQQLRQLATQLRLRALRETSETTETTETKRCLKIIPSGRNSAQPTELLIATYAEDRQDQHADSDGDSNKRALRTQLTLSTMS
jgi:hypothetical protein